MARIAWIVGIALIIASCGFDPHMVLPPPPPLPTVVLASHDEIQNYEAVDGSYLVAFKAEQSRDMLTFSDYGSEYWAHYAQMGNHLSLDPRIKQIHFISALDLSNPSSVFSDPEINPPPALQLAWSNQPQTPLVGSLARVDFRSPQEAEDVLARWEAQGLIWFAEPNYMNKLAVDDGIKTAKTNTTLGPFASFGQTYEDLNVGWHSDIDLASAFSSLDGIVPTFDGYPPIVAVMDSGIDWNHPHLADNMLENEDSGRTFCGGNDTYGCNTTEPTHGALGNGDVAPFGSGGVDNACPSGRSGCESSCCHGTHVAGIIAAVPNDEYGGVCPICQIMALRVVGKNPSTVVGGPSHTILDSSIAGAFKYASQFRRCDGSDCAPVRVINTSFGKFHRSRSVGVLVKAITDTPHDRGILVVGAAGNEDTMRMQYPAGYADAIAVANVEGKDQPKAFSSNFGRWVDVSAPGSNIVSARPSDGDDTEAKSGTSMSAPVVAGIAGLLAVIDKNMSISEMRRRILQGADPGLYSNDVNTHYLRKIPGEGNVPLLGSGIANANNAVTATATDGRPNVLALDRVEPGCAVLSRRQAPTSSIVWLLLPLGLAALLKFGGLFRKHQIK